MAPSLKGIKHLVPSALFVKSSGKGSSASKSSDGRGRASYSAPEQNLRVSTLHHARGSAHIPRSPSPSLGHRSASPQASQVHQRLAAVNAALAPETAESHLLHPQRASSPMPYSPLLGMFSYDLDCIFSVGRCTAGCSARVNYEIMVTA